MAQMGTAGLDHIHEEGHSVFYKTCWRHPAVGFKLFQLGAGDPSLYTSNGAKVSLIRTVAHIGNDDLDILLARGVNIDTEYNAIRQRDYPPLHATALVFEASNRKVAESLISRGADINYFREDDTTPLSIALCGKVNVNAVRCLVLRGGWLPRWISEGLSKEKDEKTKELDEQETQQQVVRVSPRLQTKKRERDEVKEEEEEHIYGRDRGMSTVIMQDAEVKGRKRPSGRMKAQALARNRQKLEESVFVGEDVLCGFGISLALCRDVLRWREEYLSGLSAALYAGHPNCIPELVRVIAEHLDPAFHRSPLDDDIRESESGIERDSDRERERDRDNERDNERDTDRDLDNDRDRDREMDRDNDSDNNRDNERDTDRERERDRDRDINRDSGNDRDRDRDSGTDRGNERDNDTDNYRDRDNDRDNDRGSDREKEIDRGTVNVNATGSDTDGIDNGNARDDNRDNNRNNDRDRDNDSNDREIDRDKASGSDRDDDSESDRDCENQS